MQQKLKLMTASRGKGENRSYIPCFRRSSHSIFSLKKKSMCVYQQDFPEGGLKKGSQEESKQPFQHKTTTIIWWQNWEFSFHGWPPSPCSEQRGIQSHWAWRTYPHTEYEIASRISWGQSIGKWMLNLLSLEICYIWHWLP